MMPYTLVRHHIHLCAPPRYASIPILSVPLLYLFHIVLRRSSPDVCVVEILLVYCREQPCINLLYILKYRHKGRDVLGRVIINNRGGVDTYLGQS